MKNAFIIEGGVPLLGEVSLSGAKNVALKVVIASLLFETPVTLSNIPRIIDISELFDLIKKLGAKVIVDGHTVIVDPTGLKHYTVDLLYGSKIRASFMLFAPLLLKFGRAKIPNPGGCRLGARPIDRQVEMLRAFGITVDYNSETGYYDAKLNSKLLRPANYTFKKPTHTGTELAIILSCLADGESVIGNTAQEPEIDDLIAFLNRHGASIVRRGSSIYIKGVERLKTENTIPYSIMYDRNEAPTYAVFALATRGDIMVRGISEKYITYFTDKVREAGGGVEAREDGIRFYFKKELKNTQVTTKPHPGFMTDWQGPWAVLMTQVKGISTIHETVFEDRFGYVSELQKLGAKIEFFNPNINDPEAVYQFNIESKKNIADLKQAIRINGQAPLHNGVLNVSDLRAGASLLIAASVAYGESIINGASVIDRGYEKIDEKLKNIGAKIRRI